MHDSLEPFAIMVPYGHLPSVNSGAMLWWESRTHSPSCTASLGPANTAPTTDCRDGPTHEATAMARAASALAAAACDDSSEELTSKAKVMALTSSAKTAVGSYGGRTGGNYYTSEARLAEVPANLVHYTSQHQPIWRVRHSGAESSTPSTRPIQQPTTRLGMTYIGRLVGKITGQPFGAGVARGRNYGFASAVLPRSGAPIAIFLPGSQCRRLHLRVGSLVACDCYHRTSDDRYAGYDLCVG